MKEYIPICVKQNEETSIYYGSKPEWNFTFEVVIWDDWYSQVFPDNPLCNQCKIAIACVKNLMEELCSSSGNEILEVHVSQ